MHALTFDGWLEKRWVVLVDVGQTQVERYQHRSRRRHQRIRTETRHREWCDVTRLLQFLRGHGLCPTIRVETTAADDLRALRVHDVIAFVQRQTKRLQPPALKCVVNALRSFLRCAQHRGEVATTLAAAVPAVAAWATTPALPKAISPEHAQRAIDSCN